MPRLSDSMEEGTILTWLKQVGEQVAVGEELVEIETDKANMAYESDVAGTLTEILAEEGDTLAIGAPIAVVGDAGEVGAGDEGSAAAKDEKGSAAAKDGEGSASPAAGPAAAGDPPRPAVAEASSDVGPPTASPADGGAGAPAPADGVGRGAADAVGSGAGVGGDAGHGPASGAGEGAGVPEQAAASGRVKASPLARRIASERGVELDSLSGSGPGGRIVKADVEGAASAGGARAGDPRGAQAQPSTVGVARAPGPAAAAPAPPPSPATAPPPSGPAPQETAKGTVEIVEPTRLQQVVSRRMAESKATAPHFYLEAEVDMSAAVAARARIRAMTPEGEAVPSFNDMVVKACALALREHPPANGSYRDGRLELHSRVNVGVAVAAREALVVPTVFDADRKGLREIAAEARRLAGRVRDGSVTPPELSGGTFTVSNLGMYGVSNFAAVINPPQAAILAVGAIVERPVVRGGEIATAQVMGVTLACDHRILYGAPAAEFLARVRALLEEPLGLAL